MQRTIENFPHMKVRGKRRRQRAEIHQAWRGIAAAVKPLVEVLTQVAAAAETFVRRIAEWRDSVIRGLLVAEWLREQRERTRWVATHGLTTGKES